jgi:hypothetical protein
MLESLKSIDSSLLLDVVRKDLRQPTLELVDWSVTPLRHEKVIETTGGLYCFKGTGLVGGQVMPWSLVLKIVQRPELGCTEMQELCFWRRELLAYQSGLLADLPEGVRSPRCCGVSEHPGNGWIWLEHVHESGNPIWGLAHFGRAALQLGRFAGAYLAGRPLPGHPWLCRSLFRSMFADDEWWAKYMNPASPDNAWQQPVVQEVFPGSLRERVLQIWRDKWAFIIANERLPQVLCHNDAHRRNLMLRTGRNEQEELVAIDWAFCGPGALGNDLGQLVGTSLSYFAVDPSLAVELEAVVLEGYLAGLSNSGWSGDEDLVRMGYTISLALYWGGTLPCEAAISFSEKSKVNIEAKYGRPADVVKSGWTTLAEFALDRSDEAKYLINRFNKKI